VLGLAYKPQTPVVEESQAIMIARGLLREGFAVIVADPLALDGASAVLGDIIVAVDSAEAAIAAAEVVVIATSAVECTELAPSAFTQGGTRHIVLDCWRALSAEIADFADVVRLGRAAAEVESANGANS
jgi:UDPglucose 6-dehydrogenase